MAAIPGTTQAVLIIDQLEELVTLCPDPASGRRSSTASSLTRAR